MNRDDVIKALECCSTPSGKRCENCPKVTEDALCMYRLSGDALALIKELTEENERVKADTVRKMQEALKERIKGVYLDEGEMCAIIDEVAEKILKGNTEEEKK